MPCRPGFVSTCPVCASEHRCAGIPRATLTILAEGGFGSTQHQLQHESWQPISMDWQQACASLSVKRWASAGTEKAGSHHPRSTTSSSGFAAAGITSSAFSTAAPSQVVEGPSQAPVPAHAAFGTPEIRASKSGAHGQQVTPVHTAELQALLNDPSTSSLTSFRQLLLSQLPARAAAHSSKFQSLAADAACAAHPRQAAGLKAALQGSASRKVAAVEAFIRQCNEGISSTGDSSQAAEGGEFDEPSQESSSTGGMLGLTGLDAAQYAKLRGSAEAWHTLRAALEAEHTRTSAELRTVTQAPGWWGNPAAVAVLDMAMDAHVVRGCVLCLSWL